MRVVEPCLDPLTRHSNVSIWKVIAISTTVLLFPSELASYPNIILNHFRLSDHLSILL